MAEFDPYRPSDEPKQDQSKQGDCGCGGHSCGDGRDEFMSDRDSFVSDWSGAETKLEAQAAAFEASHSEPRKPEQFWTDLVASQQPQEGQAAGSTELARTYSPVGGQSETFWADLVRSQQPTASDLTSASRQESEGYASMTKPTGMGWADDEADEWAPPEREYEPVQPAGEPVEADATSGRDDVEPASAEQDWATARSEGLAYEPSGEDRTSLMSAAVDAANEQNKAKKARKPAAKKAKAKKPATKARKPAAKKTAAKKPAAKKVVKKAAPAPKITKAPTRRAA